MLDIDVTDSDLGNAINVINASDSTIFEPAFKEAGGRISEGVVKDLRGGVASITGELRSSITGRLISVQGAQVDSQITGTVQGAYDYGGRLDKDGSLTWRHGKYAGRRTFGWFSYQTRRKGGSVERISKRVLKAALTEIINNFVAKMKGGTGGV